MKNDNNKVADIYLSLCSEDAQLSEKHVYFPFGKLISQTKSFSLLSWFSIIKILLGKTCKSDNGKDLASVLSATRNRKITIIFSSHVNIQFRYGKDFLHILVFRIFNMHALWIVYGDGVLKSLSRESFRLCYFGKFGSGEIVASFRIALEISIR